tara:strand:- start:459 stop:1358 length:900 start_codon:yes stop_codon:yes gene_type:complete
MEAVDLNIDNYDYEDILNLFCLNHDFGENGLKNAKKIVLATHPDKSGLNKEYFLFFSKAFKILNFVYTFREKGNNSEKKNIEYENTDYILNNDENNKEIINQLKEKKILNPQNFNKWFNELFEKVKINNEYESNGYGEWLQDYEENTNSTKKSVSQMHEEINIKKEELRSKQLSKYNKINEFNNNEYCDLTNSTVDNYSSGMFSKLQFEDLKKAHTESVVPICEKDYKDKYNNNINNIKFQRNQQNITPLTIKDSNDYLNSEDFNNNYISSQRAFKLAKQEEEIEKKNNIWWSNLKTLK